MRKFYRESIGNIFGNLNNMWLVRVLYFKKKIILVNWLFYFLGKVFKNDYEIECCIMLSKCFVDDYGFFEGKID